MVKVKALKTYSDMNVQDAELNRIPKEGEVFEISKDRLDILLGNNAYNVAFVEEVKEVVEKKAVLKNTVKNEKSVLQK